MNLSSSTSPLLILSYPRIIIYTWHLHTFMLTHLQAFTSWWLLPTFSHERLCVYILRTSIPRCFEVFIPIHGYGNLRVLMTQYCDDELPPNVRRKGWSSHCWQSLEVSSSFFRIWNIILRYILWDFFCKQLIEEDRAKPECTHPWVYLPTWLHLHVPQRLAESASAFCMRAFFLGTDFAPRHVSILSGLSWARWRYMHRA